MAMMLKRVNHWHAIKLIKLIVSWKVGVSCFGARKMLVTPFKAIISGWSRFQFKWNIVHISKFISASAISYFMVWRMLDACSRTHSLTLVHRIFTSNGHESSRHRMKWYLYFMGILRFYAFPISGFYWLFIVKITFSLRPFFNCQSNTFLCYNTSAYLPSTIKSA